MSSIRQKIDTYVRNALLNISTSIGYNNTINANNVDNVWYSAKDYTKSDTLPLIFYTLMPGSREKDNEEEIEGENKWINYQNTNLYDNENAYIVTLKVSIGAFTNPGQGEALFQDLQACFHNWIAAGGSEIKNIDCVRSVSIDTDDTIYNSNIDQVGLSLTIEYRENKNTFIQDLSTPAAPTLNLPANSSTASTLFPVFDWSASVSATNYHFQLSSTNSFENNIIDQPILVNNSFTVPYDVNLTNLSTYYWRVRAYNMKGYSAWTSANSFTVVSSSVVEKDWNEFTGANGWWNTYSSNALTISSGTVSAMKDQINTRNLTEATAGVRPSLSGNAWNSLSSAFFNPVFASSGKQLTYNDTSAAFRWEASTTGSIIIVLMTDGTGFDFNSGYNAPFARSNTNYGHNVTLHRGVNTGPVGYTWAYPYPSGDYGIVPIGLNIPQHIILTHSGSASLIYLNGTKIGQVNKTFTTFANEANTYLVLGMYYNNAATYASGRYYGHIFEFGCASAELTSTQVQQSYAKFKTRFGL